MDAQLGGATDAPNAGGQCWSGEIDLFRSENLK